MAKHNRELPRGSGGGSDFAFFGRDGLNFADVIDVINPLQQLPGVNLVYRWLTGDEISPAAKLAGGLLYGGPIGLAASAADVVITAAVGEDVGGEAMTAVLGESPLKEAGFSLADVPEPEVPVEGGGALASAPVVAPQMASAAPFSSESTSGTTTAREPAAGPDEPVTLSEDQMATLLASANGGRKLKPLPPPGAPAKLPSAVPTAAAASASAPPTLTFLPLEGTPAPGEPAGVADKMTSAWDKYQALLRERAAEAAAPTLPPSSRLRVDA
jgi:hypothetical protein